MHLRDFLAERRKHESIRSFCRRHGLNPMSVTLVANGHRRPGPDLARKISVATGGVVPLAKLRSDLWG